jgi:hypothetical protein
VLKKQEPHDHVATLPVTHKLTYVLLLHACRSCCRSTSAQRCLQPH